MIHLDFGTPLRNMPAILQGLLLTIELTVIVCALSLILGILVGFIRYQKTRGLYQICSVYVEVIRNTPFLVQIYLLYFGLPQFGIHMDRITAAILSLTLFNGAFVAEIIRAGIQQIPKGQWEAAECLNLKHMDILVRIILPQTIRNVFPTLINQAVIALYTTTLLSACDVRELMQTSSLLAARSFRVIEYYLVAAVFYLLLSNLLSWALGIINRKYFPSTGSIRR